MQSILRFEETKRRAVSDAPFSRRRLEQGDCDVPEQMPLIALHTLLERCDPETTPALNPFPTLLDLLLM